MRNTSDCSSGRALKSATVVLQYTVKITVLITVVLVHHPVVVLIVVILLTSTGGRIME